tara:strand:- start:150 stop:614 length:465 start_codon:yes stop_codon:yes gene_type:complete
MATQTPTYYLFRVGDGENFWNSSHLYTWGTKGVNGLRNIKKGDRMWFVTGKSDGKIIAVATFESKNTRGNSALTDEELGWSGDDEWDQELHYMNLYDLSHLNFLSKIKGNCSVRKYSDKCEVNLPTEYPLIVKYSRAVYLPCGEQVGWRLGGGL